MNVPVMATQARGINSIAYLDDWLIWSSSREKCAEDAMFVKNQLQELGFRINNKKSQLLPSQNLEWLGVEWNSKLVPLLLACIVQLFYLFFIFQKFCGKNLTLVLSQESGSPTAGAESFCHPVPGCEDAGEAGDSNPERLAGPDGPPNLCSPVIHGRQVHEKSE